MPTRRLGWALVLEALHVRTVAVLPGRCMDRHLRATLRRPRASLIAGGAASVPGIVACRVARP
eukprot:7048420-Alexandrium_andersonii.AAC.1